MIVFTWALLKKYLYTGFSCNFPNFRYLTGVIFEI
jgi:hypothetical protein